MRDPEGIWSSVKDIALGQNSLNLPAIQFQRTPALGRDTVGFAALPPPAQILLQGVAHNLPDLPTLPHRFEFHAAEEVVVHHRADFSSHVKMVA